MTQSLHANRATTLHRLRRHQFLRLPKPQGLCLRAERGSLWVTVDGDPADIELAPGQSRLFDGLASVLVGTLGGDAVISTTTKAAAPWTSRLRIWLGSTAQRAYA